MSFLHWALTVLVLVSLSIAVVAHIVVAEGEATTRDGVGLPRDGTGLTLPELDPEADPEAPARDVYWTAVIGIPTVDLDFGSQRRTQQRQSWMRYASVARTAADVEAVVTGSGHSTASGDPCARRGGRPTGEDSNRLGKDRDGGRRDVHHGGGGNGRILVRFLLGLHPSNAYAPTEPLRAEYAAQRDVIMLRMREGQSSTGKVSGGAGYWGIAAEVGMSRKAFLWYMLAPRYAHAAFFIKADDDLFLRANVVSAMLQRMALYLPSDPATTTTVVVGRRRAGGSGSGSSEGAALPVASGFKGGRARSGPAAAKMRQRPGETTPLRNVYWGRVSHWNARKGDPASRFSFVGGMFICMSRGLVLDLGRMNATITSRDGLLWGEIRPETDRTARERYLTANANHEDVMVGRWFFDSAHGVDVIRHKRGFHDVHVGANQAKISHQSVGIHHLKLDEYAALMARFEDATSSANATAGPNVCDAAAQRVDDMIRNRGQQPLTGVRVFSME